MAFASRETAPSQQQLKGLASRHRAWIDALGPEPARRGEWLNIYDGQDAKRGTHAHSHIQYGRTLISVLDVNPFEAEEDYRTIVELSRWEQGTSTDDVVKVEGWELQMRTDGNGDLEARAHKNSPGIWAEQDGPYPLTVYQNQRVTDAFILAKVFDQA